MAGAVMVAQAVREETAAKGAAAATANLQARVAPAQKAVVVAMAAMVAAAAMGAMSRSPLRRASRFPPPYRSRLSVAMRGSEGLLARAAPAVAAVNMETATCALPMVPLDRMGPMAQPASAVPMEPWSSEAKAP